MKNPTLSAFPKYPRRRLPAPAAIPALAANNAAQEIRP